MSTVAVMMNSSWRRVSLWLRLVSCFRGAESCVRSDHERGKINEYFCIPRNLCEGFCPVTYTLKHMIYQPHHRNGMHHMTGQTYLIGLGNEKNILVRFRGKNTSLGLGNKNTWPGFGNNIFGLV